MKENDGKDLWNSGRISDNPACKKDFALLAHICRLPVEEVRNKLNIEFDTLMYQIL